MHLSEYQAQAIKTYKVNKDHRPNDRLARLALGVCGEAGELAEKVKKLMRGDGGGYISEIRDDLEKEIGDVLWYLAVMSFELYTHLDRVAALNLEKLDSRDKRGMIKGSGDDR